MTSRITSKMTRGYSIDFHDGRSPEAFKGKLEPIEFLLASRSGNKKVTLIHNLDIYGESFLGTVFFKFSSANGRILT